MKRCMYCICQYVPVNVIANFLHSFDENVKYKLDLGKGIWRYFARASKICTFSIKAILCMLLRKIAHNIRAFDRLTSIYIVEPTYLQYFSDICHAKTYYRERRQRRYMPKERINAFLREHVNYKCNEIFTLSPEKMSMAWPWYNVNQNKIPREFYTHFVVYICFNRRRRFLQRE